jgi:hypothetical protein
VVFACLFGEFAEFGDLDAEAVFWVDAEACHAFELVGSGFGFELGEDFLCCGHVGSPFRVVVLVEVLFTVCCWRVFGFVVCRNLVILGDLDVHCVILCAFVCGLGGCRGVLLRFFSYTPSIYTACIEIRGVLC